MPLAQGELLTRMLAHFAPRAWSALVDSIGAGGKPVMPSAAGAGSGYSRDGTTANGGALKGGHGQQHSEQYNSSPHVNGGQYGVAHGFPGGSSAESAATQVRQQGSRETMWGMWWKEGVLWTAR
jgi:hypothetical protein